MNHRDPELVYDGQISPTIRDQIRRTADRHERRRLELEGIVEREKGEVKRATQAQNYAREQRHMVHIRFLEIERNYHKARLNLAQALLSREQFDD